MKNKIFDHLPSGFEFKTLTLKYLDEIHQLLLSHYVEDEQHLIRIVYSRDFLYWYLKRIPSKLIIGLVYKNNLIGIITANIIDIIINDHQIKMPYIDLFCIQNKIRGMGLAPIMINEIKSRIIDLGFQSVLYTGIHKITSPFCTTQDYMIPINYQRFIEIGFLEQTHEIQSDLQINNNPLHLLCDEDIQIVIPKLNKFMEKYDIKPYFTIENSRNLLIPKKNIVYSFVKRNKNNDITDFINIYKHYYYCIEHKKMLSVAQLAFYYYESMDLTELVEYLLDKLQQYGFDKLVFRNFADNDKINCTKFPMQGELNYFLYGMEINQIDPDAIIFFPF